MTPNAVKSALERSVKGTSSAFGLTYKSFRIILFMGNPLIVGFVEKQHEAKTWACSGKMTEGQASPSDCHKTAKIRSDEDAIETTHDTCFMALWNRVSNFSSESIFIFNFEDDGAMLTPT
jgi:hypothetical protein